VNWRHPHWPPLPLPPDVCGALYARIIERLEREVGEWPGEVTCWDWPGAKTHDGHGVVKYGGRLYYVHRVVWGFQHGRDPGRSLVRHTCDRPPCANGSHHLLGTLTMNARDYWRRQVGRAAQPGGLS
jgi:hypothetical protein